MRFDSTPDLFGQVQPVSKPGHAPHSQRSPSARSAGLRPARPRHSRASNATSPLEPGLFDWPERDLTTQGTLRPAGSGAALPAETTQPAPNTLMPIPIIPAPVVSGLVSGPHTGTSDGAGDTQPGSPPGTPDPGCPSLSADRILSHTLEQTTQDAVVEPPRVRLTINALPSLLRILRHLDNARRDSGSLHMVSGEVGPNTAPEDHPRDHADRSPAPNAFGGSRSTSPSPGGDRERTGDKRE